MKIITNYWMKPVPQRCADWEAYTDGYEPGLPIGFGATEEAAILDLREQHDDKGDPLPADIEIEHCILLPR